MGINTDGSRLYLPNVRGLAYMSLLRSPILSMYFKVTSSPENQYSKKKWKVPLLSYHNTSSPVFTRKLSLASPPRFWDKCIWRFSVDTLPPLTRKILLSSMWPLILKNWVTHATTCTQTTATLFKQTKPVIKVNEQKWCRLMYLAELLGSRFDFCCSTWSTKV